MLCGAKCLWGFVTHPIKHGVRKVCLGLRPQTTPKEMSLLEPTIDLMFLQVSQVLIIVFMNNGDWLPHCSSRNIPLCK